MPLTPPHRFPRPGEPCDHCDKGKMNYVYREGLDYDVVKCDSCDYLYMSRVLKHLGPQKSLSSFD